MKIKYRNGWFTIIISTIAITIGIDNYNYRRFNLYKWTWPRVCNTYTEDYHGRYLEWYFGKWLFSASYDKFDSLIEMGWYYPFINK